MHPIATEAADTVILVVSEFVTRHGGGTCTLDLTAHQDSIEVAVHDRSPQAPRMRTADCPAVEPSAQFSRGSAKTERG